MESGSPQLSTTNIPLALDSRLAVLASMHSLVGQYTAMEKAMQFYADNIKDWLNETPQAKTLLMQWILKDSLEVDHKAALAFVGIIDA